MESEDDWNRNRRDFEPVDSWKAVKEESIEIKEEPVDDFAEVKHEEPIVDVVTSPAISHRCCMFGASIDPGTFNEGNELSRYPEVKDEPVDFKEEPVDDFADIEQQQPIAVTPSFNEGNELSRNPEVKDEPVDVKEEPVDDVANVRQADPSVDSSSSRRKKINGRGLAKDEKLAKQLGLSVSAVEIAHMSTFEYESLMYNRSLTKEQQELLRKIRKRLQKRARYHKISLPSSRFKYVILETAGGQPEPEVENGEDSDDNMETDGEDNPSQFSPEQRKRGRNDCGLAADEELAKSNNLPVTVAEIAEMSTPNFKLLVKKDSLTEEQRQIIQAIRKRALMRAWHHKYGGSQTRVKLCGLAADELLAKEHNLPITAAEIAEMSTADFSMLKEQYSLTEEQLQIIKKIRHREHVRASRRKNDPFVSKKENLTTASDQSGPAVETGENCKDEMQTDGEDEPSPSHPTSGKHSSSGAKKAQLSRKEILIAKDEKQAKLHCLPITAAEIAEMSSADFGMLKLQYSLTEEQLQIIKKIRHREHCRAFRRKNSKKEKLTTASENCKDEMQTDGEDEPSSSHPT